MHLTDVPSDDETSQLDPLSDVLFDACCGVAPFLGCADVLHPQKPSGVAAVLVRETTSIKGALLTEAAFLLWCLQQCELPVAKVYVYHLRKEYTRAEEHDLESLFAVRDITRRAEERLALESPAFTALQRLLDDDPTLSRFAESRCKNGTSCPLCGTGGDPLPVGDLSTLHKGGRLVQTLRSEGYRLIRDLPRQRLTDPRHLVQHAALSTGTPQVSQKQIRDFLSTLVYPLHFLDFEALSEAVPTFVGVQPWEHVAYLYSLHIQESAGGPIRHTDFMMEPGRDQRQTMAERLVSDIGRSGSIVVYSAGFEKAILTRLGRAFPEHRAAMHALSERVVDLLDPFAHFAYYHPDQAGKLSLKRVLPLLTGHTYGDEAIADGYTANVAYRYLCERTREFQPQERDGIATDLRSYCRMDTWALVQVLESLTALAEGDEKGRLDGGDLRIDLEA